MRACVVRVVRQAAVLAAMAVLVTVGAPRRAPAQCVGDCRDEGEVTVDDIVTMVNIAMGLVPIEECPAGDPSGQGTITVDDIIMAVNNALNGCAATPTATVTGQATPTPTPTPTGGVMPIAAAVMRNAGGIALRLGETVTTEGVVTVSAGIFANRKLKVFAQADDRGIMLYHGNSGDVDAFQAGDLVRGTGVIRQEDPTSDDNPAKGTVALDLTGRSWRIISSGNPLPRAQAVTLATLVRDGVPYVGTIVQVTNVRKIAGTWPSVGSRSTQVTVSDDGGTSSLIMRMQRATLATPALPDELAAIGDGPFTLRGIVVQDDQDGGPTLLGGYEIWVRGAQDVEAE